MSTTAQPGTDIAVIGGSGFYELFDDPEQITAETPYGAPSGPITVGEIDGRRAAFLARHGPGHRFPAHKINYRANIRALHDLGVQRILAPCAVGSLRPELGPGTLLVPDQVVDNTHRRTSSFYDEGAMHIGFSDPYCGSLAAATEHASTAIDQPIQLGGTMVVIEGPRFSSRAESQFYSSMGWSIINMTGMPEAALARELAMCYTPIALVTDHDAGVDVQDAVHQSEVFAQFEANIGRLRALIERTVTELPPDRDCVCEKALDGI